MVGLVAGAVLGVLDGATAWFTPAVRDQIAGILMGSSMKGMLVGLFSGWFATKVQSVPKGVLLGCALGFAFALAGLSSFQNVGEDFTIQNNLRKIAGKHTWKFGYELIRTRYNGTASSLPGGTYNFTGTNAPFTPNTGISLANFLLGTVGSAVYTQDFASWLPRWWPHQAYAQTDWKPFRKLTLNLGVRYSLETGFNTKYGQQSQFDPATRDPSSGLMGAIVHRPGALANTDRNNFAPRVGLAWNFHRAVVFRGSFGVVHQDIFSTGANILFQEYLANATI